MGKGLKVLLVIVAIVLAACTWLVTPMASGHGIRSFLIEAFAVPTASMSPTIEAHDYILVGKPGGRAKVGDIVVFHDLVDRRQQLIKRVVAVGGQTVNLRDGRTYVDGTPLNEPYTNGRPTYPLNPEVSYPVTVPADSVWVMGDNRINSADSREYGPVPLSRISGPVLAIYWPPARVRGL